MTDATRRQLLAATISAGALGTAGTWLARSDANPPDGPGSPMGRVDARNTGHNPDTTGPTSEPAVQWSVELGNTIQHSPAVVDGTVFVGSHEGDLLALDAADGGERWRSTVGDIGLSSPAVAGGRVYVGAGEAVVAVSAETGAVAWRREVGPVRSSPTVVDGVVYAGSNHDHLHAFDAAWGVPLGQLGADDWVVCSPAVVDGRVYAGDNGGTTYAVDPVDLPGTPVFATDLAVDWTVDSPPVASPSPVVVDGTVYAPSTAGTVRAVDPENGSVRWTYDEGTPHTSSSPAVADGRLYLPHDGGIDAVSLADGTREWRYPTGRSPTAPQVVDGVLYVGDESAVVALDAATGDELWSVDLRLVYAAPTVVEGTVYVPAVDTVFALR